MNRRKLITLMGGAAVAWPFAARAQQASLKRVAILMPGAEGDQLQQATVDAFRQGLSKFGWIDGQNLQVNVLWLAASPERARAYVSEFATRSPAVVVAATLQAFLAMRSNANSTPMVFINLPDPVVMGIVPNLSKPDGN